MSYIILLKYFKRFFFDMNHFKVFIEFVTIFASVLCFGVLTARHVGSELPNQGSNLYPLHWKAKS